MSNGHPNLDCLSFKAKKIHFVGIGGIGMSALARYFLACGSIISGSDKEQSALINELKKEGIKDIWVPHNMQNINNIKPDYVVYTTAINPNNEELIWAKENQKHVLHRSDLLKIATMSKKLISVSGTHGKTTTSAMICEILIRNHLDPSAILGGIMESTNTNMVIGNGDYFVIEADESDKSFLKREAEIAVITNIESDHLENYPGGLDEIRKSFLEFAKKSIAKKGLVVCLQDKNTNEMVSQNFNLNNQKLISYGIKEKCEHAVLSARRNDLNAKLWDVYLKEKLITSIQMKNSAEHNILNALAAFGVGHLLGLGSDEIKLGLESYKGVKRRFQLIGEINDITIIDDYAHHPTEIACTIEAAKELRPRRLIIVLQPHQPRRLKDLWNEFINVFKKCEDLTFITDIYVARGNEIEGVTSKRLVNEISNPNVSYLPGNIDQISEYLQKIIKPYDLILIMGAGNITNVGPRLLKSCQAVASNIGNN